jgi:ribosomal protein S18 acetylase RimI-like enzyme
LRVFTPADLASINTFGVLPECRGRGFGRRILTATLHRLVGEGWRRVQIEVATENAAALHLYLSCGFRMQTTYDFYEVAADG